MAVSNLVCFSPPPGHSSGTRAYLPFAFAFLAGFFFAIVSPFSRVTSAPPAVRARYTAHKSFLFRKHLPICSPHHRRARRFSHNFCQEVIEC